MRKSRRILGAIIIVALVLIVSAPFCLAGEARRSKLPNGVTVMTKPASWNRIVAIAVGVEAGAKHDPPKLGGLAGLTSRLLAEGTRDKSAMELAEFIDMHGLQLETYATEDFAGFYIVCIEDNFDFALEIAAEILTRPSFEAERLLRVQEKVLARIERENEDPGWRNRAQLYELLFEGHPYSRPVSGTAKSIERITRDRVRDFYSSHYVSESTVISIVGNFTEKRALDTLGGLLSEYPRGRVREREAPSVRRVGREADEIFMDVTEPRLSIGYLTPPAPHQDYAALRVLTSVLAGSAGTRLDRALGSEGANIASDIDAFCFCADDASALVVTLSTSDLDRAVEIIASESERLRTEPVSEQELSVARNRIGGNVGLKTQTNLSRALRLTMDYMATGRVDALNTYLEQVARVSRDDVLRVAREYLVGPATAAVHRGRSARGDRDVSRRGV